jgi:predicted glycoside hydrolase/deacetylase ChbG (UPF0249 family)
MGGNPALQRLGYHPSDRVIILHADDVGMCHGANVAFLELSRYGLITCGSVMVPCPWFLEAAAMAREHPELDVGVHLTLTSEWQYYRWGPLSTRDRTSGLIDEEGYFWHRTHQARARVRPDAVEAEFRAQIETALAMGIDVTHLDTHMGVAAIPELLDLYVELGLEYRLPVLIPRHAETYMATLGLSPSDLDNHQTRLEQLESQGMPVVDDFCISPGTPSSERDSVYRTILAGLRPGITYFSLHPNAPGDIEYINPIRAFFRIDEYQMFQDESFKEFIAAQNIHILGYRPLRDLMRRSLESSSGSND